MKNKILFVTPILCHPFRGGPEMSVHNAIKAISSVSNLSLIYWGQNPLSSETFEYYSRFNLLSGYSFHKPWLVSRVIAKFLTLLVKSISTFDLASRLLEFLLYLRYLLLFSPKPELLSQIIDYCRKSSVNVVWLDRHEYSFILARQLTRIFKDQRLNVRVVLDTAAVHSDFIGRGLNFQLNSCTRRFVHAESALFRRLETSMSESCDLITAVSDEDRKIFSTFQHTQTPILLFPNVIDPDFYNVGEQYWKMSPQASILFSPVPFTIQPLLWCTEVNGFWIMLFLRLYQQGCQLILHI